MKKLFLILILLGSPVFAKLPAKSVPAAKPVPMARQLTVQQDLELKDWITGIMHKADDAEKRADAAEAAAKEDRAQTAISISKQAETQGQLTEIQGKYDKSQQDLAEAKANLATEKKLRIAADAHVSRIKTYISFLLGAFLALAVEYLLAQITLPPPLSQYLLLIRIGAPILAFGLGWLIVARFV